MFAGTPAHPRLGRTAIFPTGELHGGEAGTARGRWSHLRRCAATGLERRAGSVPRGALVGLLGGLLGLGPRLLACLDDICRSPGIPCTPSTHLTASLSPSAASLIGARTTVWRQPAAALLGESIWSAAPASRAFSAYFLQSIANRSFLQSADSPARRLTQYPRVAATMLQPVDILGSWPDE